MNTTLATLTATRNHATVSPATKAARITASIRASRTDARLETDIEVAEQQLQAALGRMLAARGLPGVKRVIKASTLQLCHQILAVSDWES